MTTSPNEKPTEPVPPKAPEAAESQAKPNAAPSAPANTPPAAAPQAALKAVPKPAPPASDGRKPDAPAPQAALKAVPKPEPVPPAPESKKFDVARAVMRSRHYMAVGSFLLIVVLPFLLTTLYLYAWAADQYHSKAAFSVRSEHMSGVAGGLLGAITQIGGGTASDPSVIYEYIRSQKIVEDIDAQLDLRAIYNKAPGDFIFALGKDATTEQLLAYWNQMVTVSYETNGGIIHVQANAFTPQDAHAIAQAILAESNKLVNRLSEQARADAIKFASLEHAEASDNLAKVRARMAEFRNRNHIVDPSADVAGQMGLLNALQSELAGALVQRDMLSSYADESDQRMTQANRRITAITERIASERQNLGVSGDGDALPEIVASYEELRVDTEFANRAYVETLAGLAAARAEARRQSRYLAAHVEPTLASTALYPRRAMIAGLTGLFLALGWGVFLLIYYKVRDNR